MSIEFDNFNTYFYNEEQKRITLQGTKTFKNLQKIKKLSTTKNFYKYKNHLINLQYRAIHDLSFYNTLYEFNNTLIN